MTGPAHPAGATDPAGGPAVGPAVGPAGGPAVGRAPGTAARPRAAVLGAGSWGTVFAKVLADAGTDVVLWGRRGALVEAINERRENPDYLPGVRLPERLRATADPAEALDGTRYVMLAVPAQTLRGNLAELAPLVPAEAVLVSLMKGVELGTSKRMSEVIREVVDIPERRVGVVSGPNLAREIAAHEPAAAVVACADEPTARDLQAACTTPYFRPYTNTDVVGCELGGAVKNIIALAVGIAVGMGFGDNVRALMMTRGLAEIARLGAALGADQHTFAGLAGMGDLVATCSSPLSRNRTFGENLGRGMSLDEVIATTRQTAEGVKSSESVLALARKHNVEMPITEVVVAVMHDGLPPQEAARLLMSRTPKPERYGV
jgi:glycerol-3-phosphate dehydrogenase (NAD(P)+)